MLLQPVLIYYLAVWSWFLVEKKPGPCELCSRPGSIIYRPLRAHTQQQNVHAKVRSEILTRALGEILLYCIFINF
jgi:hypothetical protein